MVTIRAANITDIPVIQSLAKEIWDVAYKEILSAAQIQYMLNLFYSTAALTKQMTEQAHQFILATEENTAVGFASFSPKSAAELTIYRLHKIYIHPNQQGKGTGKTVLTHIINTIQPPATGLELNVNRHNKARSFYEKQGFTVTGEEDIDIGNGYFMNDYIMLKPL